MKKKILLSLLVLVGLFTITGCGNSENKLNGNSSSKNKTYECRYSKDDNAEGKRFLTKYIVELNNKNEAEVLTVISGYNNYGSETDGYKNFCNSLNDNSQKDILEKYKDVVSLKVVCDEENNYEAYALTKYQIKKIKDIDDFSNVYKFVKPYIKDDGTFDLDAFKNYFNTDELKKGNYTCDF